MSSLNYYYLVENKVDTKKHIKSGPNLLDERELLDYGTFYVRMKAFSKLFVCF